MANRWDPENARVGIPMQEAYPGANNGQAAVASQIPGTSVPAPAAGAKTGTKTGTTGGNGIGGFQYDLNGDTLYQQYKKQYQRNAQRSMKDTMGQAAGLTGGYGSSYAQNVGQQAYDQTMAGLNDIIPQLEERAYNRSQQAYGNLTASILQSGYQPTAEELAAAGMTAEQANALRQAWIGSNPNLAYMNGAITAEQYYKLTGQYAPGMAPTGGGGGYGGGGRRPTKSKDNKNATVPTIMNNDIRNSISPNTYGAVTGIMGWANSDAMTNYANSQKNKKGKKG